MVPLSLASGVAVTAAAAGSGRCFSDTTPKQLSTVRIGGGFCRTGRGSAFAALPGEGIGGGDRGGDGTATVGGEGAAATFAAPVVVASTASAAEAVVAVGVGATTVRVVDIVATTAAVVKAAEEPRPPPPRPAVLLRSKGAAGLPPTFVAALASFGIRQSTTGLPQFCMRQCQISGKSSPLIVGGSVHHFSQLSHCTQSTPSSSSSSDEDSGSG